MAGGEVCARVTLTVQQIKNQLKVNQFDFLFKTLLTLLWLFALCVGELWRLNGVSLLLMKIVENV